MGRGMKNIIKNIFKILTVTAGCLMFASFSPSLDGRAVVVDKGVFPQGLFAKTVGYLPGDIISVTNIAGDSTIDLLVIGALDPSEGVAIMLSPEAADAMGIDKGANNIVKITKRSGQDERVYGNAVISKSAAEIDDFDDGNFENISAEENTDAFDEEEAETEEAMELPVAEEEEEEALDEEAEEDFAEEPEDELPAEEEADFEESADETEEADEEAFEEEAFDDEAEEPEEAPADDEDEAEEEAFDDEALSELPEEEAEEEFTEEPEEAETEDEEEGFDEEAFDDDEVPAAEPAPVEAEEEEEAEPEEEEPAEEGFDEEAFDDETPDELPAEETEETEEAEEEAPAAEAFEADELESLPVDEESESDEYEAIVLVPVDSNPPESDSDSDEVIDVTNESDLVSIDEELDAEPAPQPAPAANPKKGPATSYDKYMVSSLKDLEAGKYYIQIAAYGSDENILDVINKYGNNYPITIVPMAGGKTKQVLIGPVSMDEYKVVLERFKSYGFKDAFLRKVK